MGKETSACWNPKIEMMRIQQIISIVGNMNVDRLTMLKSIRYIRIFLIKSAVFDASFISKLNQSFHVSLIRCADDWHLNS